MSGAFSPAIGLGLAVGVALCFTWWKRQVRQRAILLAHLAHLEQKLEASMLSNRRLSAQMGKLERRLVLKGLLEPEELDEAADSDRRSPGGLH